MKITELQQNIIRAFAHPIRLQIIVCIDRGEKTVTELIAKCDMSQSAVSQHLALLREVGILTTRKDGRLVLYKVKNTTMISTAIKLLDISSSGS